MAVPVIIYAVAAYGPAWASRTVLILGLVGGVMLTSRNFSGTAETGVLGLTISAVYAVLIWMLVLFSWTLGDLTRVRRLQLQTLADRARRLEIEQQQERSLAAADERAHIAREMHDIVAHSLSVIITQADGARYAAAADPAIATETLATVAATARGSLRGDAPAAGGAAPGGWRLHPAPAQDSRTSMTFSSASAPPGCGWSPARTGTPRRTLPPGAELTAYRALQEALTNVLKHAGPQAGARVLLSWQSRGLQLDVHDDGRGAAADPADGAGNGLRGMRRADQPLRWFVDGRPGRRRRLPRLRVPSLHGGLSDDRPPGSPAGRHHQGGPGG